MSDQELKFPNWQVPFQEAILEFDPIRVRNKIQQVETLILERLQHLPVGSS